MVKSRHTAPVRTTAQPSPFGFPRRPPRPVPRKVKIHCSRRLTEDSPLRSKATEFFSHASSRRHTDFVPESSNFTTSPADLVELACLVEQHGITSDILPAYI